MILVDAHCFIRPERQEDFAREVALIIPVVLREAGCTRYELLKGDGPGQFHFIEEWASQKHLDDHIAQSHMQAYFAVTTPWHVSPTRLKIYEIRSTRSVTMDR